MKLLQRLHPQQQRQIHQLGAAPKLTGRQQYLVPLLDVRWFDLSSCSWVVYKGNTEKGY
jgi:hypothetical protein